MQDSARSTGRLLVLLPARLPRYVCYWCYCGVDSFRDHFLRILLCWMALKAIIDKIESQCHINLEQILGRSASGRLVNKQIFELVFACSSWCHNFYWCHQDLLHKRPLHYTFIEEKLGDLLFFPNVHLSSLNT